MTDVKQPSWRERLADRIPPQRAEEIDTFENQMHLRKQGKLEEKVFAELRLRRGVYGQRYDNGKRHDGIESRELAFPNPELTKGPDTKWDAPGMQRIKIPYGGMTPEQMDVLADCAEEYSDNILHVTTRQDIQLHYVHIEDTPDIHRRLAAVGITTREACGNSVRNITGCPYAGICRSESFDISPYADAMTWFLLGHRDVQDFGRKFKIAFSGCEGEACGLTNMHDLGLLALVRNGKRGFRLYVGGGLGAVPHEAKVLEEWVPEEEILPLAQAVARVYARLGEKKDRNKARIKFLVAKLGIDEFRRLVREERKVLEADARWSDYLPQAHAWRETPLAAPVSDGSVRVDSGYDGWYKTNVYKQAQAGFSAVTIHLPLGDITSDQFRRLADIVRTYAAGSIRTTVEQNLILRWIHNQDLPALYNALAALGLATPGAASISDVTSCPGTDTCKLGISSSRGLGRVLRDRFAKAGLHYDDEVRNLRVKISGCFNSCGQHHVADIGFFGSSRNKGNYRVPHFQVVLGGEWANNGGSYGTNIGAVPSKAAPQVAERLIELYKANKQANESFRAYVQRVGKKELKAAIAEFTHIPDYDQDSSFYVDWSDSRLYSIGDIGVGECAGEVITLTDFSIAQAESQMFDAQVALEEEGDAVKAYNLALAAMYHAAQGLIKIQNPDIKYDPDTIVAEFKARFVDTQLFFDPYVKGKFADMFFTAHAAAATAVDAELAKRRIQEAGLFIEACHACNTRLLEARALGQPTTVGRSLQP